MPLFKMYKVEVKSECPYLQKTKSERLNYIAKDVMRMKSEHLIHMKAKSECLIDEKWL